MTTIGNSSRWSCSIAVSKLKIFVIWFTVDNICFAIEIPLLCLGIWVYKIFKYSQVGFIPYQIKFMKCKYCYSAKNVVQRNCIPITIPWGYTGKNIFSGFNQTKLFVEKQHSHTKSTDPLVVSTTRTTLSALSFIFQLNGNEYLTQQVVVKKIIQGFKKA